MIINYRGRKLDVSDVLEEKHEAHFGHKIGENDIDRCVIHVYGFAPEEEKELFEGLSDEKVVSSITEWIGSEIEWLEASAAEAG